MKLFELLKEDILSNPNFTEKFKNFAKQAEMMAGMLGSYVEHNLSKFAEKEALERQLKSFLQHVESLMTQVVQERTGDRSVEVRVKALENFVGELPRYQTKQAAGFDVVAQLSEPLVLKPGERELVPTGLSFEIPDGFELQARPRSGLAIRKGIGLVNSPGTIDADYRGEVKIILINLGQESVTIEAGERIAQLVLAPVYQATFKEVENLNDTDRGAGGFGSTGVRDVNEAKATQKDAEAVEVDIEIESFSEDEPDRDSPHELGNV